MLVMVNSWCSCVPRAAVPKLWEVLPANSLSAHAPVWAEAGTAVSASATIVHNALLMVVIPSGRRRAWQRWGRTAAPGRDCTAIGANGEGGFALPEPPREALIALARHTRTGGLA